MYMKNMFVHISWVNKITILVKNKKIIVMVDFGKYLVL